MGTRETAEYVRAHLVELEKLSRADGLDTMAYLIHLATLEAQHILGYPRAPGSHHHPL